MADSGLPKLVVSIEGRLDRLRADLRKAEDMVAQTAGRIDRNTRGGGGRRSRGPSDSLFGIALSQREVGSAALPGVTKRMMLAMAGFAATLAIVDQALRGFAKAMGDSRLSLSGRLSQGFTGFTSGFVEGVRGIPILGPTRDLIAQNIGMLSPLFGIAGMVGAGWLQKNIGSEAKNARDELRAQVRTEGMVGVVELQRKLTQQGELASLFRLRPDLRQDAEIRLKAQHELDDMKLAIDQMQVKFGLSNADVSSLRRQAGDVNLLGLIRDLKESDEKRQMIDLSEAVETALGSFKLAGSVSTSGQRAGSTEQTQLAMAKDIEFIANWLGSAQFGFT